MAVENNLDSQKPQARESIDAVESVKAKRRSALMRYLAHLGIVPVGVGGVGVLILGVSSSNPWLVVLGLVGWIGASKLMFYVESASKRKIN